MGKKSKILYASVLLVNIVFFILDLLPINFPFFRISFAVSLMLIGLLLLVRAVSLKIDSGMFIGLFLLLCGVLNFVLYFLRLNFGNEIEKQFWAYYLFALALSSLVTGLYFKDKLQLKLTILFCGFGVIVCLYVFDVIELWLMITLLVVWFVAYFVTNVIVNKRKNR